MILEKKKKRNNLHPLSSSPNLHLHPLPLSLTPPRPLLPLPSLPSLYPHFLLLHLPIHTTTHPPHTTPHTPHHTPPKKDNYTTPRRRTQAAPHTRRVGGNNTTQKGEGESSTTPKEDGTSPPPKAAPPKGAESSTTLWEHGRITTSHYLTLPCLTFLDFNVLHLLCSNVFFYSHVTLMFTLTFIVYFFSENLCTLFSICTLHFKNLTTVCFILFLL